jgi:undecaprenyl-diphosphatase
MKIIQTIHAYDVHLFLWVCQRKTRRFQVQCARVVSRTGDGYLYLALGIGLALSSRAADRLLLEALLLGFLLERPLYFLLKNLCRRERPPTALKIPSFIIPSDRFSFPSGHTSAAFLVACLVGSLDPALALPLLVWATGVGMSRVILGVHFPTDTLIGALMGSLLAFASLQILLH